MYIQLIHTNTGYTVTLIFYIPIIYATDFKGLCWCCI